METGDGWRPLSTMPESDVHILFIEGYCMVPWMEKKFAAAIDQGSGTGIRTFRVWLSDPHELQHSQGSSASPDAFGIDRCIQEIESGVYHCIVVVDYSNDTDFETFETKLGRHLQAFVQAGGVAAFPSSEGLLVSTFQKLFDTTWERSGYYRTTWGPCVENELNVNYSFGNGNYSRQIIVPYSAKGTTLRNVPPNERCFGVTSDSRTQSMVPFMNGRDVSKPQDPTSATATDLDAEYDIIVAMHNYGKGCVAYFGDVNCEDETIALVEVFCLSRCPQYPIDCFAALDETTFAAILEYKEKGNASFKQNNLSEAQSMYRAGVDLYGSSKGKRGPQRDILVTLYSNLALVHFRAKSWSESEACASMALQLDEFHHKILFQRATARHELAKEVLLLSTNNTSDGIRLLKAAKSDVIQMPFESPALSKEAQKLLAKINLELKRLQKSQKDSFRDNFAGALLRKES